MNNISSDLVRFNFINQPELGSEILSYCPTRKIFDFILNRELFRIYHSIFLNIVISRHMSKFQYVPCEFIIKAEHNLGKNNEIFNNLKEKITSLSIKDVSERDEAREILRFVSFKLKSFSIEGKKLLEDSFKFTSLKEFNFSSLEEFVAPSDIDDTLLKELVTQSSKLKTISLKGCVEITNESIKTMATSCSSLESINLAYSSIDDEGLKAVFDNCSSLTSLNLILCSNVTGQGLKALKPNTTLTSLDLSYGGLKANDDTIKALIEKYPLTSLSLGKCLSFTGEGLKTLDEKCSLKSLNLEGCMDLTDNGVRIIAEKCSSLTYLSLRDCTTLTDDSLEDLAQNCPSLEIIEVTGNSEITDSGIKIPAEKCHSLTNFDLSACFNITNEGIRNILKTSHSLTSLNLMWNWQITDEAFKGISINSPLNYVNLIDTSVTANGIKDLKTRYPSLIEEMDRNKPIANKS